MVSCKESWLIALGFGRIITKQDENGSIEIDEETFTEEGETLVKDMIAAVEAQKVRRASKKCNRRLELNHTVYQADTDTTRRAEGMSSCTQVSDVI